MKKISCTCKPKKRGCSHFAQGKCRLMDFLSPCVMRTDSYHYKCCPIYKKWGMEWEKRRNERK